MSRPGRSLARLRPGRAWLTIRLTALLLAVLVLVHFAVTHLQFDVAETDSRFVAERWRSGLVVAMDWLMLVAAVLHGGTGAWIVIDELESRPGRRRALRAALAGAALAMLTLGTWTLVSVLLRDG